MSKMIKEKHPDYKTVFIGPCTAKKAEAKKDDVKEYIDCVITFEELIALIKSQDIKLKTLEESALEDATAFGRSFARSGGVTAAVIQSIKEQNINFEINPLVCDGIENLKIALAKANKGLLPNNFIEGMVCTGGCIGGPCALTHAAKDKSLIDKHAAESKKSSIVKNVEEIDF